jgi:hypothetical protein
MSEQASLFYQENTQNLSKRCLEDKQSSLEILMSALDFPSMRKELETRVLARTGNQLRNLGIELSPDGIRLCGQTTTFYVKQLAQHCVHQILPAVRLVNDINVL